MEKKEYHLKEIPGHLNMKIMTLQQPNYLGQNQFDVDAQQCIKSDDQFPQDQKNLHKNDKFKCLRKLLHSIPYQVFITLLTLLTLYGDDIRIAWFNKDADLSFDIINLITIAIFTIQIILSWLAYEQYRCSFFFFLDIVSTLSIFLDVGILTDTIYQNSLNGESFTKLAEKTKASRVATRTIRIVKLFRLIRIVKLYKSAVNANEIKEQIQKKNEAKIRLKQKKEAQMRKKQENYLKKSNKQLIQQNKKNCKQVKFKQSLNSAQLGFGLNSADIMKKSNQSDFFHKEQTQQNFFKSKKKQKCSSTQQKKLKEQQQQIEYIQNESHISKILSDMTLKKVIIVVLLLMFLIPLFDTEVYIDVPNSWSFILLNINKLLENSNYSTSTISLFIQSALDGHQIGANSKEGYLLYFQTPFQQFSSYQNPELSNTRIQDIISQTLSINSTLILSKRSTDLSFKQNLLTEDKNTLYAMMNIKYYNIKQAYFSIARTTFICIVLMAMLHFFKIDIDQWIVKPIQLMMHHVMQIAKNPQAPSNDLIVQNQYQTALVHNAIVKIGALLSLVFGSAGAEIIGSNIMKEGDINPLLGGKKKCAIFGFCDIRNFAQITQVLQEDIMIFVNTIGELVHSAVYRYAGGANKNIGQAFLLVWKIEKDYYQLNEKTNEIFWKKPKHLSVLADFSILSFVKTLVKINKDPLVLEYRKDPRLKKRFGNNYKVSMGFGLHIGWAIQGAIGSEYKIDASYLSPNVNMASRLQAATKQFGIDLLVSQALYDVCTHKMKKFLRNIDRVTVKGSNKPLKLFTVDMNLDKITPPRNKYDKYPDSQERPDVQLKRQWNMQYLRDEQIDNYDAQIFVSSKKQLKQVMINAVSDQFKTNFQTGLNKYLLGKWLDAKQYIEEAIKLHPRQDGPSKKLLQYMLKSNFIAPQNWSNYRPLTSK